MTCRIYDAQKVSNSIGDWVRLVDADMSELGISLTNEQIQSVSKNVFNNFVKKKIKLNMLKYFSEKKKSHSKAKYLNCENFQQAEYIRESRFTTLRNNFSSN